MKKAFMKAIAPSALIISVGLTLTLAGAISHAATPSVGTTPPVVTVPPTTTPVTPQRPVVVTLPTTPVADGTAQIPSAVKDKLDSFKAARTAYVDKQKEIIGSIRNGTTEEQRQAIQDNIEEFRTRLQKIKDEFRNQDLKSVIDAARASAESARNRRGEH